MITLMPCIAINILSVFFLVAGLTGFDLHVIPERTNKVLFVFIAVISVGVPTLLEYYYYPTNDKYKQIIEYYDLNGNPFFKRHPFIMSIIAHIVSIVVMTLSAWFYNAGGIHLFSNM
jgi:hypothetical protein